MSDFLSQEEIESLLKKSEAINTVDHGNAAGGSKLGADDKKKLEYLCNQSMKTVSESLAGVLEGFAQFKMESLEVESFSSILERHQIDKIGFHVNFSDGFTGNMMVMIPKRDGVRLARKILSEPSSDDEQISDVEMNTIFEVLNQIAEQTAIEWMTQFRSKIVVKAPEMDFLTADLLAGCGIGTMDSAVEVRYTLSVAGLFIACEFIQIFPLSTALSLARMEPSGTPLAETMVKQPAPIPEPPEQMGNPASQMLGQDGNARWERGRAATVQKPQFSQFSQAPKSNGPRNIDMILDVPLEMSVVLGRAQRTVKQILSLEPGSIVELNKYAEEPLDIYVNGKLIGQGEVVVVEEKFGIRVNSVVSTKDRTDFLR